MYFFTGKSIIFPDHCNLINCFSLDLRDEEDTENKLGPWISENPNKGQKPNPAPEHQAVASTAWPQLLPAQPGSLQNMFEKWFAKWKGVKNAESPLLPRLWGPVTAFWAFRTGLSQSTSQWCLRSGTGFHLLHIFPFPRHLEVRESFA